MEAPSKVTVVLAIVLGAIAAGAGLGWLASRDSQREPALSTTGSTPVGSTSASPTTNTAVLVNPLNAVTNINPTPNLAETNSTNWEEKVADIMDGEDDATNKVKALLGLFPQLPADGQVEVAQDLGDLVPDDNFGPLADLLKDAKLPPDVLDVLMADALGRPNAIKLPLLLEVARNADHPKAADAKDVLEVFTGEDYGNDWILWQQKVAAWLQENPD